METVRLTSFSRGAGCACKLGSSELTEVLRPLLEHPAATHPGLVVGMATSDDAGVVQLPEGDGRALVQTVDFFTPIVDDARTWGMVAAANALSDIYAMGATPLSALQLLGWPRERIPFEVSGDVIGGGADIMAGAGCVIVGGHSIDQPEPTYGFAVSGLVDIVDVVTNTGARPGDRLVLTKPIGSGIVTTAHKAGECPPDVLAGAVDVMVTLNAGAGAALRPAGAHAATDVTGFGLVGHLAEMVDGSGVGAVIDVDAVPVMDGVRPLLEAGFYPSGSRRNAAAVEDRVGGTTSALALLADAQTSGGLLVALPDGAVDEYLGRVAPAVEIGRVTDRPGHIELA